MEAKHTETPWMRDQYGNVVDQGARERIILTGFSLSTGARNAEAEANTDFVFRACNAHDELVKALQLFIQYDDAVDKDDVEMMLAYADAIQSARAALQKAGA